MKFDGDVVFRLHVDQRNGPRADYVRLLGIHKGMLAVWGDMAGPVCVYKIPLRFVLLIEKQPATSAEAIAEVAKLAETTPPTDIIIRYGKETKTLHGWVRPKEKGGFFKVALCVNGRGEPYTALIFDPPLGYRVREMVGKAANALAGIAASFVLVVAALSERWPEAMVGAGLLAAYMVMRSFYKKPKRLREEKEPRNER